MSLRHLLIALALLLAACQAEPAAQTPTPATAPAATGEPAMATEEARPPALTVMATVAPIADVVRQVGGERVEVISLVPAGTDAHTYEPRPSDVVAMERADAFVGVGYDLNPAAVRLAEANLPDGAPVVLLGEEALDEGDLIAEDADDHGHSHGDESHSHGDDGHSHGDDGHTHDDAPVDDHTHERNPHVWTSIRLTMQMAERAADVLGELDPEGEADYRGNAEDFLERLADLDEVVSTATATIPEGNRVMVVYHDAWGYFAGDYGLEVIAAVQPSDFAEPSAAEVRAIIDQVREADVPALFGSEVFPSRVVEAIAAETGAEYVGTLSDDALPGAAGDPQHSYEGLMIANARTIIEALGGDASALDGLPGR
jgi:ABC-type Zn uptake system ZnuABC Zn-binding protein ZnuA